MLRSIRNVKLLKCVSLICLSLLFVFYSSLNYDGPRTKAFKIQFFALFGKTYNKLRGSLPKSGPLDFATKNTFPLFFVAEEALVGIY